MKKVWDNVTGEKMSMKKYQTNILAGKQYQKSNNLINAKGTTTLLAQKIFSVGIQQAQYDESTNQLVTTLYGTDLRKIFGTRSGSFYDHLKELVEPVKDKASLLDWRIIYTNDDTKELEALNVVTDCKFKDGIFEMRFNGKITKEIYQLKENYTQFSLEETIPLRSIYSYRLYEILKSEFDKQNYLAHKRGENLDNSEPYILMINIVDLKLKLGIIDPNENREIINALKKSNVDYDYINKLSLEASKKTSVTAKYNDFSSFRRNTIDVAKKELDEKTSISFEYEPIKAGKGGKVSSVRFYIYSKKTSKVVNNKIKAITAEEKEEIIDQMIDIIDEKLKVKDLKAIAEAASYDIKKIVKAYKALKHVNGGVDNVTGFMITAIKDGYETPVKSERVVNNSFNDFEQNDYDFDELEKQIIDN